MAIGIHTFIYICFVLECIQNLNQQYQISNAARENEIERSYHGSMDKTLDTRPRGSRFKSAYRSRFAIGWGRFFSLLSPLEMTSNCPVVVACFRSNQAK